MTRLELGLLAAAVFLHGVSTTSCTNSGQNGDAIDVIFYGRVPDTYEVCFVVDPDFTELTPSLICDREQQTAYSFNMEVAEGADQDGNPCSFDIRWEEPVSLSEDGTFSAQFSRGGDDFRFLGAIDDELAQGLAAVEYSDGTSCEITLWMASPGPVCRQESQEACDRLLACCESMYLLPPTLGQCLQVVDACDGEACEAALSGYVQCLPPDAGMPDGSTSAEAERL